MSTPRMQLVVDDDNAGPSGPLDDHIGHLLRDSCEKRIRANDLESLKNRRYSGDLMLSKRGDAKRLPNGFREALLEELGVSSSEINHRMKLAEKYQVDELSNLLDSYLTWGNICRKALHEPRPTPKGKKAPPPIAGPPAVGRRLSLHGCRTVHHRSRQGACLGQTGQADRAGNRRGVRMTFDTTPKPYFLQAMRNQSWNMTGAIAELVDNSFGSGRGNAEICEVIYNPRQRTLAVVDNGIGTEAIGRLFQLGNTIGRTPGDIGMYGSGGHDGHPLACHRGGGVQPPQRPGLLRQGGVVGALAQNRFPQISDRWQKPTLSNCLPELLAHGHGTAIVMKIAPERGKINVSNIRRDLAKMYGPGIRAAEASSGRRDRAAIRDSHRPGDRARRPGQGHHPRPAD